VWNTFKAIGITLLVVCGIGIAALIIYWGAVILVLGGLLILVFVVVADHYDSKQE